MSTYLIDGVPLPLQICEPREHTDECVGITTTHHKPVGLTLEQTQLVVCILLQYIAKAEKGHETE